MVRMRDRLLDGPSEVHATPRWWASMAVLEAEHAGPAVSGSKGDRSTLAGLQGDLMSGQGAMARLTQRVALVLSFRSLLDRLEAVADYPSRGLRSHFPNVCD